MTDALLVEVLALEAEVWEALVGGDAEADSRLLAEDFIGVYPTGFAVRADHVDQLDDGPTVSTYAIADARIIELPGVGALLMYRADYRRTGAAGDHETMYVSSLWVRRTGAWVNVFSQDTPAGEIDPP